MRSRWSAPAATLLVLLTGLALQAGPFGIWGWRTWYAGLVLLGLPVAWRTLRGALAGRFAADLVATLAIVAAIALEQPLAGLVVVLMQTGGEALEHYAAGRASRAVQELEAAAPRRATRLRDTGVEEIPAEQVLVGDRLLIRPGDLLPCDGRVTAGASHVDSSRITGEAVPVSATVGTMLLSGSRNLDGPLTLEATAPAEESQYARIVQLVRTAQESKSPLQRMADRYAVGFTPITLGLCLGTWLVTGDPVRILAILVVATPCPLILAAPVAMIGGLSRAARRSIIIRHGEALERLGQVSVALVDKTGTLTIGRPEVSAVRPVPPLDDRRLLALAAAVDAGSGHLLARSVVQAAEARGVVLPDAESVIESPGQGVAGLVDRQQVAIGARSWVEARTPGVADQWPDGGSTGLRAWVTVDGRAAGVIEFADRLRPEGRRLVEGLRRLGLQHVVMVTGDDPKHARAVAEAAGIAEFRASMLPEDKVRAVEALENAGERVLMIGDGTNDAPALSRASVGVALAAHGGGISAEAADAVVLEDDPERVVEAVVISRQTLRIARQSVWAGLGLSGIAMVVAAFGAIPPTIGALLQEVIDVAVILNALRTSSDTNGG